MAGRWLRGGHRRSGRHQAEARRGGQARFKGDGSGASLRYGWRGSADRAWPQGRHRRRSQALGRILFGEQSSISVNGARPDQLTPSAFSLGCDVSPGRAIRRRAWRDGQGRLITARAAPGTTSRSQLAPSASRHQPARIGKAERDSKYQKSRTRRVDARRHSGAIRHHRRQMKTTLRRAGGDQQPAEWPSGDRLALRRLAGESHSDDAG